VPARMQSLRDKLLKAGLVSEDQAKKAESEVVVKRAPLPPRPERTEAPRPEREGRREERRDDRGGRGFRGGPAQAGRGGPAQAGRRPAERTGERPIPKLPPLPGSKAAQREESRKQLELDRKVRELVGVNEVALDVGATVFYFMTRKKKLRRLTLTEPQAQMLERGDLAVVERPDPDKIEHALVPAEVAEQIFAVFPKAVRFFNRKENPIGFMTDDELRHQQQVEADAVARGEAGEGEAGEGEGEAGEGEAAAEAEAAAAASGEATPAAPGSEPGPDQTA
jgi:Uncharacterized protein conserved in bacteria (DUF2058)